MENGTNEDERFNTLFCLEDDVIDTVNHFLGPQRLLHETDSFVTDIWINTFYC